MGLVEKELSDQLFDASGIKIHKLAVEIEQDLFDGIKLENQQGKAQFYF
jgi:hypothetical protein